MEITCLNCGVQFPGNYKDKYCKLTCYLEALGKRKEQVKLELQSRQLRQYKQAKAQWAKAKK